MWLVLFIILLLFLILTLCGDIVTGCQKRSIVKLSICLDLHSLLIICSLLSSLIK